MNKNFNNEIVSNNHISEGDFLKYGKNDLLQFSNDNNNDVMFFHVNNGTVKQSFLKYKNDYLNDARLRNEGTLIPYCFDISKSFDLNIDNCLMYFKMINNITYPSAASFSIKNDIETSILFDRSNGETYENDEFNPFGKKNSNIIKIYVTSIKDEIHNSYILCLHKNKDFSLERLQLQILYPDIKIPEKYKK